MNKYSLTNYQRPNLKAPNDAKKMVLHSCCAPCSAEVIDAIRASGIEMLVYFYNPNIHPVQEYELRKKENIRYCEKHDIEFIDADYDTDNWFERVKGLEWQPERGARCTACFDMRFERTALFSYEHGYQLFSSSLAISRWKDMEQINGCGERAAKKYEGMQYWTFNWRKQGGSARMIEISKKESFYQQEYCGCVYSLRDTNLWRKHNNRKHIRIGEKFYGNDEVERLNEIEGLTDIKHINAADKIISKS